MHGFKNAILAKMKNGQNGPCYYHWNEIFAGVLTFTKFTLTSSKVPNVIYF